MWGDGMSIELTKEILDERFVIDLEAGIILNRIKTAWRTRVGEEAGWQGPNGYRQIGINGRTIINSGYFPLCRTFSETITRKA